MPTLVIQLPNLPPVEHVLKDDAVTIGRMKGNTIALDDNSVSLSHAKLTRMGGDYFLKDLNSTNGTLLNGQSFNEARLRDGDHLKFGEVKARYHTDTAPPPAQMAAPAVVTASAGLPSAPVEAMRRQPMIAQAPASMATARTPTPKKKFPLILMLAGAGVAVATGLLVWKFGGSKNLTVTPQPQPTTAAAPTKISVGEKLSAPSSPTQIPVTALATQANSAESSTNQNLPALIKSLKAADPVERRHAAAVLNSMGAGSREAVPALREAIKDSDSEVRMLAALSLINNKVYDKATVPILIQMLRHENPIMRQVACFSLVLIPYEKEPVISALTDSANKDDNAEVRNAAVSALKMIVPAAAPASH